MRGKGVRFEQSIEGYRVCYNAEDLLQLILLEIDPINLLKSNITQLAKKHSNKLYEYFVAISLLYDYFNKNCEFCFNLKQSFDPGRNEINSISDLEKYRDDPPDIIVLYEGKYYYFELKRYKGVFSVESIVKFINNKIIQHYNSPELSYNYLIELQLPEYTHIELNIFEEVSKSINGIKHKIIFTCNANNSNNMFFTLTPEFKYYENKFRLLSSIVKDIKNSR